MCNIGNAGGLAYIYGVHGGGFGGSSAPAATPTPTRTATPTPTITPTPTSTPVDIDGDGFLNPQQTLHLGPANTNTLFDNCPSVYNPAQTNTDGNFIDLHVYGKLFDDLTVANSDASGDACDTDSDNDGLSNATEQLTVPCASATGPTNQLVADTDLDRVLDGAECVLGTDPANEASKPPASPPGDTDHDGLTDAFEATIGTNPAVVDTDGDKINDGVEYQGYNTNPLVANTDGDLCGDGKEIASLNADSVVNSIDQLIVAQSYGTAPGPPYRTVFDVNKDGRINSTDQLIQAQAWGYC